MAQKPRRFLVGYRHILPGYVAGQREWLSRGHPVFQEGDEPCMLMTLTEAREATGWMSGQGVVYEVVEVNAKQRGRGR